MGFFRIGILVAALGSTAFAQEDDPKMGGTGGSPPVEETPLPEPEVIQPEAAQPQATEPEPEVMQPEVAQPQATEPEPISVQETEVRTGASTGPYFLVGGGADFYTGNLASQVNPGPSWGATVGFRPFRMFGLELGYNGAVNEIDRRQTADVNIGGADIVRNAGQAALIAHVLPSKVQPYILGGVGVENYNVRGGDISTGAGFSDDTLAYIPAGLGVRAEIGRRFTADLRGTYNFLISQDFVAVDNRDAGDARIGATLNVGGTF